jgi:hypothetical protein
MSSPGTLSRRDLVRLGTASWLGLGLPELLRGRAAAGPAGVEEFGPGFGRAKACILLFMWGGPAHQDTWDLKPDAPVEIRGEFRPIPTNVPGIDVCEHLPLMAQRANKLCLVRSMTHTDVDHTTSTHYLLTGRAPPASGDMSKDWPSLGSVLSRLGRGRAPLPPFVSMRPKLPGDPPRFVEQSQGQFAGWLGSAHNPLTIDEDPNTDGYHVADFALQADVSTRRLDERSALLASLDAEARRGLHSRATTAVDQHYARAFDLLDSTVGQDAFDVSAEPAEVRDRYGRNAHGQTVLQARRLVERGIPLVTVFWPNDGIKNVSIYWDTHSRNFIDLRERLMPTADQAFSALLDDLSQCGMLDETLVVWTGEFGRTPKVGQRVSDAGAGKDGRDHWPHCFTTVLAGGGVRGGTVYGKSDAHAAYPAANPVHPMDLMSTAHHLLGVPPELAFPDAQGRPQVICPGRVVTELLG